MTQILISLQMIIGLSVILGLSCLAYWKPNAVLFMIIAGVSMMVGLEWYDAYTNTTGLGISLVFIAYSLVAIAYGYKVLLWNTGKR